MSHYWDWLWTALWNLALYIVTLQWTNIQSTLDYIRNWFSWLWDEIVDLVDDVRSFATDWINYALNYAWSVYGWATAYADDIRESIVAWVYEWVAYLEGVANNVYAVCIAYAYDTVMWAYNTLYGYFEDTWSWVYEVTDYYYHLIWDRIAWVTDYYDLIAGWLVYARDALNWLWQEAIHALQAFIADPIGFVLGTFYHPIIDTINAWATYGAALVDFAINDLPDIRSLLATGFSFLMNFIDRPVETVLELLVPTFVDWLAGLIADSW